MKLPVFTLAHSLALATVALAFAEPALGQNLSRRPAPVQGEWVPGFGVAGVHGGWINDWTVFDDGSGPAVYACGKFRAAGDEIVGGIARWDGDAWHTVGEGLLYQFGEEIYTVEAYDDGNGPKLYVGGRFIQIGGQTASGFARWDGTSWEVLPGQVGFGINTFRVGQGPSGPVLYAGGEFIRVGSAFCRNVAMWNGSNWSPLGTGVDVGPVHSLALFDDGTGEKLFAGAQNLTFPFTETLHAWNGTAWSPVAGAPTAGIYALEAHDDGSGEKLFVGGGFPGAGGVTSQGLITWDGSAWASPAGLAVLGTVHSLTPLPSGSASVLMAGGQFRAGPGGTIRNVAAWTGLGWSGFGQNPGVDSRVDAMLAANIGAGLQLFVGGQFREAGGKNVQGAAIWDGFDWQRMGEQQGLNGSVSTIATLELDTGTELYVGGTFSRADGVDVGSIARWDQGRFEDVGGGLWNGGNVRVNAMARFRNLDGDTLAVGGFFQRAGGANGPLASNVARWNGIGWAPLGTGTNGEVKALSIFGTGPETRLFAGGQFTRAGGIQTGQIAAWDGANWSSVGAAGNLSSTASLVRVNALTVHDDGSGPALWVGGEFDFVGGELAQCIAKWDGSSWSVLPFGGVTRSGQNTSITELRSVNLPSAGRVLAVTGLFDAAGGVPANGLAFLGQSGWFTLGNGQLVSGGFPHTIGSVENAAGVSTVFIGGAIGLGNGILEWTGRRWVRLGQGLANDPDALAWPSASAIFPFDDGSGPALFVGGTFEEAGGRFSWNIAKWQLPTLQRDWR